MRSDLITSQQSLKKAIEKPSRPGALSLLTNLAKFSHLVIQIAYLLTKPWQVWLAA
jgi:hypothetical protein